MKSNEIEIKYEGLKVKHVNDLLYMKADASVKDMVDILEKVTNVNKATLYRCEVTVVKNLYNQVIKDLEEANNAQFKEKFVFNNKKYKFVEEHKQPVGWYIDATSVDITPAVLMALYYIEAEAKNYSEVDEQGFQKYDMLKRADTLNEAPLIIYIGLLKRLKKKYMIATKLFAVVNRIEQLILEHGLRRLH